MNKLQSEIYDGIKNKIGTTYIVVIVVILFIAQIVEIALQVQNGFFPRLSSLCILLFTSMLLIFFTVNSIKHFRKN